jgi:hypothetical protein
MTPDSKSMLTPTKLGCMRIDIGEERSKGSFASNCWITPTTANPACGSVVTIEYLDGHHGDISSI